MSWLLGQKKSEDTLISQTLKVQEKKVALNLENKGTLFSLTFKVQESKVPLIFRLEFEQKSYDYFFKINSFVNLI